MKPEANLYHAYIVTGPSRELCNTKAAEIAKAVVCGKDPACGVCTNCRKTADGIHPDIIEVSPPEGKRLISVEQIREIRSEAYTVPNDAEEKVYVIYDAETMNSNAQNAFLKVLEEPPSFTHFILITQNAGELLQTVRSRCKQLLIAPGTQEDTLEKQEEARALLSLLAKRERIPLLAFLGELEKYSRTEGLDLFCVLKEEAAKELRDPKILSIERAMEIMKEADTALKFLNANVSMGHVLGHVLSELL